VNRLDGQLDERSNSPFRSADAEEVAEKKKRKVAAMGFLRARGCQMALLFYPLLFVLGILF
jgi:hypothetical protein